MVFALDPTLFEGSDPMSAALDAFVEKLEATTDPYGGKYLNDWMTTQGGGTLLTFDGLKPVDFEPDPQDTPAVIVWADLGNPFEARGEGDRRFSIGYNFEGWLYTLDQRLMFAFMWRVLAAVGYPWMSPVDPVARVQFVRDYRPVGPMGGRPFKTKEDPGDVCVWKFKIVVDFAGSDIPFFRAG